MRHMGQETDSVTHPGSGAWLCLESVLERRWQDEQENEFCIGPGYFIVSAFPAICYFQAKIDSSILGGLAHFFFFYFHASAWVIPSSGVSSPLLSGLQCHLLQEAHLSPLGWSCSFLLGAHVGGALHFFLSSPCTAWLPSLFHDHTVSPSRAGTV